MSAQYIENIKRIQAEKRQGILHYLPIPDRLSRLAKVLPGIGKQDYLTITGNTGSAKSTFMRDIVDNYVMDLHNTYGNQLKFRYKFFVNILEESVEDIKYIQLMREMLEKHNIKITRKDLTGRTLGVIPDEVLEKLIECADVMEAKKEEFKDYYEVSYYSIGNPFGFYNEVRKYAHNNGKFVDKNGNKVKYQKNKAFVYDRYIPDNPYEIVVVITDHIGLYTKEGKNTWYETLEYFSKEYCRRQINLNYGYAVINVQQQNSQAEQALFDNKGNLIVESTFPRRDSLGNITITNRDATTMLGLWNPYINGVDNLKIGQVNYPFAALQAAGKECRVLSILKNRHGGFEGKKLPIYFDFSNGKAYQLPTTEKEIEALI